MKRPVLQATLDFCNEQGVAYDPGSGEFTDHDKRAHTNRQGTWVNVYWDHYPAPVLAWALTHGLPSPDHTVRQINGDPRDLRLANLECVPDRVASSRSSRTSTGCRNVSLIGGRYRAKVKKDGRYHIRDFDQLQDAADYVNEIKGVRKQFTGKAAVEGVTRVDTVRRGKPYTYWRACLMHHGRPIRSTFSTREKAEAWRPITKKRREISPEDMALFKKALGF